MKYVLQNFSEKKRKELNRYELRNKGAVSQENLAIIFIHGLRWLVSLNFGFRK